MTYFILWCCVSMSSCFDDVICFSLPLRKEPRKIFSMLNRSALLASNYSTRLKIAEHFLFPWQIKNKNKISLEEYNDTDYFSSPTPVCILIHSCENLYSPLVNNLSHSCKNSSSTPCKNSHPLLWQPLFTHPLLHWPPPPFCKDYFYRKSFLLWLISPVTPLFRGIPLFMHYIQFHFLKVFILLMFRFQVTLKLKLVSLFLKIVFYSPICRVSHKFVYINMKNLIW